MARYYENQWPAYVSVAERRAKAERAAGKLCKKGAVLSPVTLEGRKIATTFWGKAWCENLESYRDYANRLERGRSYVRNGLVIDLQIAPHTVTAMVSGSSVYSVKITINEVQKTQWASICADCAGGIDSLVELLQGRFSKGVMDRICRQGTGLFPKPSEIRFSCSCPDGASMCKHVAASLYGVGARLDAKPELLFRLRGVNENDLVANIGNALPMSKQGPAAGKVLEADDMAALFGLDMGEAAEPSPAVPLLSGNKTPAARKPPGVKSPAARNPPGVKSPAARNPPGVKSPAARNPPGVKAVNENAVPPKKVPPKVTAASKKAAAAEAQKPVALKEIRSARIATRAAAQPGTARKVRVAS